ncbi:MAG: efflux RND transporter periplasmic adaptor subunit [bacterium]|nr:MAG: efflux RND transporter periplasmic adaptor subunit [bacterium]
MNVRRVALSATAVTALFACIGCGSNGKEERPPADVHVRTVSVVRREIAVPIRTSGLLSARYEKKLSFKTGGIVAEILADEGESIGKGQALARLDLSEIHARVAQARSAHQKAKRDLARLERLFADSVATLEQLQDSRTGAEVAGANLEVAEFNLKHSTILAPSNGTILKRFVEADEMVSAGMPIFLFGSTGADWIIRFGVSDRELVRVALGDPATVSFDAYSGVTFDATVSEIAGFADPMSGTYEVELHLEAGDYVLHSGFVAKVELIPSKRQQYFIIPVESLVEGDGDRGYVFELPEGSRTVRKVPVRVGLLLGDEVAVIEGLEDVERVVKEGASYLFDGAAVKPGDD